MTIILAALMIILFTITAVVAKTRKVKRAALIGLISVMAALDVLFLLAYARVAYHTGKIILGSPWAWLPFVLLCMGIFAAAAFLKKLNRGATE